MPTCAGSRADLSTRRRCVEALLGYCRLRTTLVSPVSSLAAIAQPMQDDPERRQVDDVGKEHDDEIHRRHLAQRDVGEAQDGHERLAEKPSKSSCGSRAAIVATIR